MQVTPENCLASSNGVFKGLYLPLRIQDCDAGQVTHFVGKRIRDAMIEVKFPRHCQTALTALRS